MTTHHLGDMGDTVLLEVSGELDLFTGPLLEDAVATALIREPATLVIDLTGVSFLASVGITVLLKAHRSAGPLARVRVVAPEHSVVKRILRLTGLQESLAIVASRADALAR